MHTVSTHSITHLLLETRWIFFAPKSVLSLSLSFCPGLFFLFALFFVLLPPSFLQSVSSFGEAVAVNHRNRQTQREKKRFSYTHTVIKGLGFSPPSLLLLLLVLQLLWPSVSLFLCVSLSLSLHLLLLLLLILALKIPGHSENQNFEGKRAPGENPSCYSTVRLFLSPPSSSSSTTTLLLLLFLFLV